MNRVSRTALPGRRDIRLLTNGLTRGLQPSSTNRWPALTPPTGRALQTASAVTSIFTSVATATVR